MVQREHMKNMIHLIKSQLKKKNGNGIVTKNNNRIIDNIAIKYLGDLE